MAWTTPRTWVQSEFLDAAIFNTHVRDNLDALKNPPTAAYTLNEGSNYTTTSSTFTDVDATDLSLQVTTTGGDIYIYVFVTIGHSLNTGLIYFDLYETGAAARVGGDDGLVVYEIQNSSGAQGINIGFMTRITAPAAGTYTYRLQWKTSAATATLYAGAGTSNYDVHGQMWVREMT